jgi:hypothetical protein
VSGKLGTIISIIYYPNWISIVVDDCFFYIILILIPSEEFDLSHPLGFGSFLTFFSTFVTIKIILLSCAFKSQSILSPSFNFIKRTIDLGMVVLRDSILDDAFDNVVISPMILPMFIPLHIYRIG